MQSLFDAATMCASLPPKGLGPAFSIACARSSFAHAAGDAPPPTARAAHSAARRRRDFMTDRKPKRAKRPQPPLVIGWREMIGLPDIGVAEMKAKIDTGARTSALHAREFVDFTEDGEAWVEFTPVIAELGAAPRIRAPLIDQRAIKNTSGVPDDRHVILTRLSLGGRIWPIEVSLADREQMEFDLILGRTAIRKRGIVVDPGKSFLVGPPGSHLDLDDEGI